MYDGGFVFSAPLVSTKGQKPCPGAARVSILREVPGLFLLFVCLSTGLKNIRFLVYLAHANSRV